MKTTVRHIRAATAPDIPPRETQERMRAWSRATREIQRLRVEAELLRAMQRAELRGAA